MQTPKSYTIEPRSRVMFDVHDTKNERDIKPQRYIDEMLERHKNLLELIDKKTKWKGN